MPTYEERLEDDLKSRAGSSLPDEVIISSSTAGIGSEVVRITQSSKKPMRSDIAIEINSNRDPAGERIPLSQGGSGSPSQPCLDYDYAAPPVTARTLQELEIKRIINNPKLRHDVNFDPHLYFRPNTDGIRGQYKRVEANAYWNTLHQELRLCAAFESGSSVISERVIPRVCRVLYEIREILRTLVPNRDLKIIDDALDLSLLMQQVRRSNFDYSRLALWLSKTLKTHCAPMRDAWIDEMVMQFRSPQKTKNHSSLVEGIRMLFGILEAMKLDVANHQVRHLRTLLIQETVVFECDTFLQRIKAGQLDISSAQRWYARARQRAGPKKEKNQGGVDRYPVKILLQGLTEGVLSPSGVDLPETFTLDEERLQSIRSDLHNVVWMDICVRIFEVAAYEAIGRQEQIPNKFIHEFRSVILLLVRNARGKISWRENMTELALEIDRRVYQLRSNSALRYRPNEKTVQRIELYLRQCSVVGCKVWQSFEDVAREHVRREGLRMTLRFLDLPLVTVADLSLDTGLQAPEGTASSPRSTVSETLDDIAKRLAQIASLHWRVFGPLVYLPGEGHTYDGGNKYECCQDLEKDRNKEMRCDHDQQIGVYFSEWTCSRHLLW